MENRFKIRVWDNFHKKLRYNARFRAEGGVTFPDGFIISPDWYVVMQCVGFMDKTGNLIYEGDILRYFGYLYEVKFGVFVPDCTRGGNYGFYRRGITKVVKDSIGIIYNVDGVAYCFPPHCGNGFEARDAFKFEVVGNIYENPELLKE